MVRGERLAPFLHAVVPHFAAAVVEVETEVERGQAGRVGVRLGQAQVLQGVASLHLAAVLATIQILACLADQDVAGISPADPRDEGHQTDAQAGPEELEQVVPSPSETSLSDCAVSPGAGLGDLLFEPGDFLVCVADLAFQLVERGEPDAEVAVVPRDERGSFQTEVCDGVFDRASQGTSVPVFLLGEDERRKAVLAGDAQVALCRGLGLGLGVQCDGRGSRAARGRHLGQGRRAVQNERQGYPCANDSRDFHGV